MVLVDLWHIWRLDGKVDIDGRSHIGVVRHEVGRLVANRIKAEACHRIVGGKLDVSPHILLVESSAQVQYSVSVGAHVEKAMIVDHWPGLVQKIGSQSVVAKNLAHERETEDSGATGPV